MACVCRSHSTHRKGCPIDLLGGMVFWVFVAGVGFMVLRKLIAA